MNYKVKTIPRFDKDLKHLAKKYPSLKNEYFELIQSLKEHPQTGTPLATIASKYVLLSHQKGKGNLVGQER